jgi:hypothetical protein
MEEKRVNQKIAKELRAKVFEMFGKAGIEMLQISGSKYALDIEHNGEFYRVDISAIVPNDQDFTAQDLNEEFLQKEEQKRIDKEQKEQAKQKKIERDKKLREQKKKEKEDK